MSKLKYLDHIDSLRALAVLLVLFFHLDIVWFKGGFIGVDVFFVISGFLITRNILNEYKATNGFNFSRFYYRRVKRLLPSFFLMLIFVFALGFLLLSPSDFIGLNESVFMSSVALSNFYFLGDSGYFDTAAKLKPLLHTWSLSVEEQYYFIWPLTLFVLVKVFHRFKTSLLILLLLILTFLGTLIVNKTGIPENFLALFSRHQESPVGLGSFLFYMLPFRAYEFLIGGLLVFIPAIHLRTEKAKWLLQILGFMLIIVPASVFDERTDYLSVLNIIPCLGIALLIIAPQSKYFKWFYYNKYLRETGNASYTIYLFHWPIIVFYKHLFDKPLEAGSMAILFVVSLAVSMAVYKYFETPFRYNTFKKIRLEYLKMAFILFLSIAGSYLVRAHVVANNGWVWRLDEENLRLVEEIGVPLKYHYANWGGANYTFETELENKNAPKDGIDLIWLGDSHSGHFAAGLDSVLVSKHGARVHISYVSCFVLPDIRSTNDLCTVDEDSVLIRKLKLLEENPDAPLVISYYWRFRLFSTCEVLDEKTGEVLEFANNKEGYEVLFGKIKKLRDLTGEDRKIILIGESPARLGGLNYIEKLLKPGYLSFISPPTSAFNMEASSIEFNDYMKAYFKDLDNFYFIDPSEAFCEDGTCLSQEGTKIYFSDVDHFSIDGSIHVMTHFEDTFLDIMSR